MKLPVIKHLTQFIEENDQDYIIETIEVLEAMTEISSLKIVKNIYRFFIDDWHFAIETSNGHTLLDLIYSVDAKIFDLQQSNRLSRILVLDHFELIAENTFRIHVKN